MRKTTAGLFFLFLFLGMEVALAAGPETLKGVYLSQSSGGKSSQKISGSFYMDSKTSLSSGVSFVDLQVLEPLDKLITYRETVEVKGIVSKNVTEVMVAGTPVRIMDQGIFYAQVNLNKLGKHLIEIAGRIKSQELVLKKRVLYLASFPDVKSGQWASDAIEYLATLGYLKGTEKNDFNPGGKITRAELAVILSRLKTLSTAEKSGIKLGDVQANFWAAPEIMAVVANNLMATYAGYYFYPYRILTRAEFFDSIRRLEGLKEIRSLKNSPFSDIPLNHWAAGSIESLKRAGWFSEMTASNQAKFYPDTPITRKELAFWLAKVGFVAQNIKDLLDWEKGFEGKEVLETKAAPASQEKAAAEKKPEEVKLAEIRAVTPPAEKGVVEETKPEKVVFGKEEAEAPKIQVIAPQKPLIPGSTAKTVSFDLKDVELTEILKIFSQEMGNNIVPSPEVAGRISVAFNRVPILEAFETILKLGNLSYLVEGDVILVYPIAKVGDLLGRQTIVHIYHINYAVLDEVVAKVSGVVSKFGTAFTDRRLKLLVVRDLPENLDQIDELVKALDEPPKQVLVQAMLLDVDLTEQKKMGVRVLADSKIHPGMTDAEWQALAPHDWTGTGYPPSTVTSSASEGFYIHVLKQGFKAFLSALQQTNDVDVLATPSIIALNHEKAVIFSGDSKAYTSQEIQTISGGEKVTTETISFFETGITMELTPHISEEGFILMEIIPEVSTGGIESNKYPYKKTTKTSTKVMVKDGQTVLLGGLIREENKLDEYGVPFLGQLPFIGTFFRRKEIKKNKRELVILITPHIIDDKMLEEMAQDKAKMENTRFEKQRSYNILE
jgi:type IV pilus secretin PilQ/predicted competence protein